MKALGFFVRWLKLEPRAWSGSTAFDPRGENLWLFGAETHSKIWSSRGKRQRVGKKEVSDFVH